MESKKKINLVIDKYYVHNEWYIGISITSSAKYHVTSSRVFALVRIVFSSSTH